MATKQEITDGLNQLVVQSKRVASLLDAQGDWDASRPQGWTPRQIFSHLASVGSLMTQMGPGMLTAPESFDMTQTANIGDMNAQSIAAMEQLTPPQLVEAIEANYLEAAEWVNSIPDDQLQAPKTFAQMTIPASDVICNVTVLHGYHHLYEAANRIAF